MLSQIDFTLNLIRHGESEINATPDAMGQSADVPLTKKGKTQAMSLRNKFLKRSEWFDFIYSSPYTRALDTANIVKGNNFSDKSIILAEELREYSAGGWTGGSRSKTLTEEVKNRMAHLDHCFLPPDGESLNMVERRAGQWIEQTIMYNPEMIELSRIRKDNGFAPINIACFSHGMTIKCILHYIMGFDKNFTWKINIENTSITKVSFGKSGWVLHYINDHSHLY